MSGKREKQRMKQLKREYEFELFLWSRRKPPIILFWRYRKWKKSRPVFNKRAEPTYRIPRFNIKETYTGTKRY